MPWTQKCLATEHRLARAAGMARGMVQKVRRLDSIDGRRKPYQPLPNNLFYRQAPPLVETLGKQTTAAMHLLRHCALLLTAALSACAAPTGTDELK